MQQSPPPEQNFPFPGAAANAHQQQVANQCLQMQRQNAEAFYAVIQTTINNSRNIAALISPIPWLPVTKELLALLGETSTAEYVLALNAAAHLSQQRPAEAGEISDALRTANAKILYHGQRNPGTRKCEIVVREPGGLTVFLPIKFVRYETEGRVIDQCIASTAYKIRDTDIRRLVKLGRLRPVGPTG